MSNDLPALPIHELRPFLHGIQLDPEDDLAIRALGDWLEELGDVRAELVRAGLFGDLTTISRWRKKHGKSWWGTLPRSIRLEVRRGLLELLWPTDRMAAKNCPLPGQMRELMTQGWVYRVVLDGPSARPFAPWAAELLGHVTAIRWERARSRTLDHLPELPRLRELDLCKSVEVDADGLAHLGRFPGLWRLYLSGCEALTNASLAGFAELRHVRLGWNPRLVAVGLRDLPELRVLSLTMNDNFRVLNTGELPELRELSLRGCAQLLDEDLAPVAALSSLETLDLDGCVRVGGYGLANLSGSTKLRELTLSGCAALARVRLANLPALRSLELGSTGVEEIDLSQLPCLDHVALADCRAVRSIRLADLPRLEGIGLNSCRELTHFVAEDLPLLRSLNLAGRAGLKDLQLRGVAGLKHLDLRNCKRLTSSQAASFASRLGGCKVLS